MGEGGIWGVIVLGNGRGQGEGWGLMREGGGMEEKGDGGAQPLIHIQKGSCMGRGEIKQMEFMLKNSHNRPPKTRREKRAALKERREQRLSN